MASIEKKNRFDRLEYFRVILNSYFRVVVPVGKLEKSGSGVPDW